MEILGVCADTLMIIRMFTKHAFVTHKIPYTLWDIKFMDFVVSLLSMES